MDGSNGANATSIDIKVLAKSLEGKVMQSPTTDSKNKYCSIFKVPDILLKQNERAYVPNSFSIGPFHHGTKPELEVGEMIKLQYLHDLVKRKPNPETSFQELITAMANMSKEAGDCYAAPVLGKNVTSQDEFVKILVVDGCFIVELLRKGAREVDVDEHDPIFNNPRLLQFLAHDLLLLENQVPWSVLERIFTVTEPNFSGAGGGARRGSPRMAELALQFSQYTLRFAFPRGGYIPPDSAVVSCLHLLDLCRLAFLQIGGSSSTSAAATTAKAPRREGEPPTTEIFKGKKIPSVTDLVEAGIEFESVDPYPYRSLLDIKFKKGVLEIPQLTILEMSETILRNLVCFEQCYPHFPPRFTSYVLLLDYLVGSTKDVRALCNSKIFLNWYKDEEVVHMFHKICSDAWIKDFHYEALCDEVNQYCKRKWPRWRATYFRFFGTPWGILTQVVAVAGLLLTFLQTLYTIKGTSVKEHR
ncbi:putative UPF0481 protein At3g02645 [Malania oleifera]|uniref:putative UPF0481 protein At3g02645 n=1 Tax=Malania oleifera TaxID=397392 RepID=UPI0025ADD656|nr:putative UPF0481 protein At3g02645 [Malania oleifera]